MKVIVELIVERDSYKQEISNVQTIKVSDGMIYLLRGHASRDNVFMGEFIAAFQQNLVAFIKTTE